MFAISGIVVFCASTYQGEQCRMVLVFFEFLKYFFYIVLAIFDLVHDVEAIRGLCKLLTASRNLF